MQDVPQWLPGAGLSHVPPQLSAPDGHVQLLLLATQTCPPVHARHALPQTEALAALQASSGTRRCRTGRTRR